MVPTVVYDANVLYGAGLIVTFNLRGFPLDALQPLGIVAQSPDDFLLDVIDLDDRPVMACVQEIAYTRRHPPVSVDDVLDELEAGGLVEAVAALREARSR